MALQCPEDSGHTIHLQSKSSNPITTATEYRQRERWFTYKEKEMVKVTTRER